MVVNKMKNYPLNNFENSLTLVLEQINNNNSKNIFWMSFSQDIC